MIFEVPSDSRLSHGEGSETQSKKMAPLETIARKLGENKNSFLAISIIQVVSTIAQFCIYLSLLIYYNLAPRETYFADKTVLYIVIFSFPTVQVITLATSIVWMVYNLLREGIIMLRTIFLKISIIGNVIQVLLGLVSIALGIFLAISSPATVLFIVLSSVIAVLEIWSLIACISSFAQHKWIKIQVERLRRRCYTREFRLDEVEGHERMVDEEHEENLN